MRRALLVVITLCWSSLADATEVLVCEASAEGEYLGDTLIRQYELRLAIDDTARVLAATTEDATDFELIGQAGWALSGSLRIVTIWRDVSDEIGETKISGFATQLPSQKGGNSLVAVVFHDTLNPYPLVIRADVWDEGSPFFVFDSYEGYGSDAIREAFGTCR